MVRIFLFKQHFLHHATSACYSSKSSHISRFLLLILPLLCNRKASLVAQTVKSTCNERDPGSIPGSGRFPGGENGNPLQYSCLENTMDRGAWRAIVHGGHKESDTTEWLRFHLCNLGKWYWITYLQGSNGETDLEKDLWTWREGRRGWDVWKK